MFRRTRRPPFGRKRRRGAAAVEFALVAPVLFLVIFGIVEVGRAIMVQQLLTNASREGARHAVIESSTSGEVVQLIQEYLNYCSISHAEIQITPENLATLGPGDSVSVGIKVPLDKVSWVPIMNLNIIMSAKSVMKAERFE